MLNGNLKLAIQKKGRLSEKSLELLRACGIEVENYSEKLIVTANNFDLDLLFLRDDDIPEYVQDGVADLGIVGEDVLQEKGSVVRVVRQLGFGRCKIMIASPENVDIAAISDLEGKTIATSFPKILSEYLTKNKIDSKIIELSGSVEIAPSLGIADLICDIVSTGNTLKLNKLKKSFSIFESQAVLIGTKKNLNPAISTTAFGLFNRINSALTARNSKYLMMNVPIENIDKIIAILPSLKSPTILPLADKSLLAVHAVIPTELFWGMVDDLKSAGATGILLLQIENMVI